MKGTNAHQSVRELTRPDSRKEEERKLIFQNYNNIDFADYL